jgi:hypothetical protein
MLMDQSFCSPVVDVLKRALSHGLTVFSNISGLNAFSHPIEERKNETRD